MKFRDLSTQYHTIKKEIDQAVLSVMADSDFISGKKVGQLEARLAEYVGVKHCITCANGTDALLLAIMAWGIGPQDAVFIPDFTFFATGEIVAFQGATPVFVDVEEDTFNMSPGSLEQAIKAVLKEKKLTPRAVIAVDLFGLPADYSRILPIAEKYNLKLIEDAAQGFGGSLDGKMAGSFGELSTASFFPAKPLGCYGDGGAIFTNDTSTAKLLRSLAVHGKGEDKYDNVRIGMNSRLDTIQAAILDVKLDAFIRYEHADTNKIAARYTDKLTSTVKMPFIPKNAVSSWAQYTIRLKEKTERDNLMKSLEDNGIPTMVYYPKPLHQQKAFEGLDCVKVDLSVSELLCDTVLSIPIHPYLTESEQDKIVDAIHALLST